MENQSHAGLAEKEVTQAISAGGMDQSINWAQQIQVNHHQYHWNQVRIHPSHINHNLHRTRNTCQESGHLVLSSPRPSAQSRTPSRESQVIMHVNSFQRTTSNDKESN
eukprot:2796346-Amphidinium_carterae.1